LADNQVILIMKKHDPINPSKSTAARTSRSGKRQRQTLAPAMKGLEQLNLHAAGIDVGSAENYLCVPENSVPVGERNVRKFGVFSQELDASVEWLKACGVTTVAMEATGVYWMSLYDKIETAGLEVILVDPHSVKHVPGRKSDVLDCQWLQQLHTYGLLRGAFRPDSAVRNLRSLCRQRADIVINGSAYLQQAQKALVQMNVQLPLVVSDINGQTGLRIIDAILNGERDPEQLVKLRDERCKKSSVPEMQAALKGHYTPELLFVLSQTIEGWRFCQRQLEACDQQIVTALAALPTAKARPSEVEVPPKPGPVDKAAAEKAKKPKRARGNNQATVDFNEALRRVCGVDLMRVCGLNVLSVLMLIGEIGADMRFWRSEKAFCSWLGLCPGTKISGGRVLSRRTRHVVNRAATILRLAAMAAGRTDTWIGRFYRRKQAHLGAPKAITATARKLACVLYHMLKYKEEFLPLNVAIYDEMAQERRLRRLRNEAQNLGYQLVEVQQVA
jgi:transposase